MLILFFGIFIFLLTFFESLTLAFIIFGIGLTVFLVISVFKKFHKKLLKTLLYFVGSFVVVVFVVYIKNYIFFLNFDNSLNDETYFTTGTIVGKLDSDRYVFKDIQSRSFTYKSSKDYNIGDKIYTFSYITPAKEGCQVCDFNLDFLSYTGGDLKYEFDYNKWLFMRGYYGNLYETKSIKLGKADIGYLTNIRKNFKEKVVNLYGENKYSALLLGLLIGDESYIKESYYQDFINSGIVHIIAVSGGNILMIVIFLSFALLFLPFYIRLFAILLFITFYSFLCGLDSSVFRAWIMGGLSLIALFFGRSLETFRALKYAFVVMLLVNPYLMIYDLGFILSFAAVLGIVYIETFREKIQKKVKKLKYLFKNTFSRNYMTPTMGATLGVFPFLLFFNGQINLFSVLANILILPLIPFTMIYGFFTIYLYEIFSFQWILDLESYLLEFIYLVSDYFANHGLYVVLDSYLAKLYILLAFILLFMIYNLFVKKFKV